MAPDALALADLEDALAGWLASHGVDREWMIAPSLAAAGADIGWCERAAAILAGPALEPGLEWVASALSAETLLAEVKGSTQRISALVAAMKSYTQMDRASMQRIDVTDGLESTLVMLGHMLRDGITVVRDYGAGVPSVEAHAGELNQVWTNLIGNAVEAMDGKGTLRLSTRATQNDRRHRGGRHWLRNATGCGGPCVRALLHDQGRGQKHRPRPGHRPPHHHRTSRRDDRYQFPARPYGAPGPDPGPDS